MFAHLYRILVLLIALTLPVAAQVPARLALLIGNEAYGSEIGGLANPHNDVALLEQTLKGLGFEVVTMRDAGLGALTRAVNAYARRLQAAGPNAIGFFYYSGHGASDGNANYLIPADVKTTETGELWDQSLRLTEITRKLKSEAGNATHFVVFDACRNTLKLTQPGSRAVVQSKGFVPLAQETGMLIAYATAEGELASDVGAGAGPYAKALAEEIVKPDVEAVVMFRAVQRRMRATIRQEPYLVFNALGDIYLAGMGEPPIAAPEQSGWSTAEREWQQYGKVTKDIRLLEAFKEKHRADPVYVRLAEARIEELKREELKKAEAERQALLQRQQDEEIHKRAEVEAHAKGEAEQQRVALLQKQVEDSNRNKTVSTPELGSETTVLSVTTRFGSVLVNKVASECCIGQIRHNSMAIPIGSAGEIYASLKGLYQVKEGDLILIESPSGVRGMPPGYYVLLVNQQGLTNISSGDFFTNDDTFKVTQTNNSIYFDLGLEQRQRKTALYKDGAIKVTLTAVSPRATLPKEECGKILNMIASCVEIVGCSHESISAKFAMAGQRYLNMLENMPVFKTEKFYEICTSTCGSKTYRVKDARISLCGY
jgi:uncharacterized caspase-like protein